MGGRSTYGVCDFALSWMIRDGHAGGLALSGLAAVMVGSYNDDEAGSPWRVALYVDERASEIQHRALADVFLGKLGGTPFKNFASAIGEVYAVRRARIALSHTPGSQRIDAGGYVTVEAAASVGSDGEVSCGISGHDHPGQEMRMRVMRVEEGPLRWELAGRCGFAASFDYRSDES